MGDEEETEPLKGLRVAPTSRGIIETLLCCCGAMLCLLCIIIVLIFTINWTPQPANSSLPITYMYYGEVSQEIRALFDTAAAEWGKYVLNTTTKVIIDAGVYCDGEITLVEPINANYGIVVFVRVEAYDGIDGVLGYAGPCAVDDFGIPRAGIVVLDSADIISDIDEMIEIIMHEIGHVMGLGTIWTPGVTYLEIGGIDGYPYQKENANAAHVAYGGVGANARVENQGGSGTAGSHWKEAVYDNELMTGYVEGDGIRNIMSRVTLGALRDIGYEIDLQSADHYRLPGSARRLSDGKKYYHNDTKSDYKLINVK